MSFAAGGFCHFITGYSVSERRLWRTTDRQRCSATERLATKSQSDKKTQTSSFLFFFFYVKMPCGNQSKIGFVDRTERGIFIDLLSGSEDEYFIFWLSGQKAMQFEILVVIRHEVSH